MSVSIWWIRRDLRLADNPALKSAIERGSKVIPLFIVDPKLVNSSYTGDKRLSFLWGGLNSLAKNLHDKGSRLILREGDPLIVLTQLVSQTGANLICAEADFSPYARSRDRGIGENLPLSLVGTPSLRHPNDVVKMDGMPYTVFTPYMKSWRILGLLTCGSLLSAPDSINTPQDVQSDEIPDCPEPLNTFSFQPEETNALERLDTFTLGERPAIFNYKEQRDRVDMEGTSQISPYLRFGMISIRQAISRALDAISTSETIEEKESAETWLNELIWREFYISILYHFPFVLERSFRKELADIGWVNNEQDFHAWCYGHTGYPIIDAAMRQLLTTGWMHNRARMITASFLVKDLLIDWRWGERWFMQHLIDGDPAANNGGWQWVSGTGTDSVPYFRIFNPILQSKKCDPDGKYIRKWIPELEDVPGNFIHEPWKMPFHLQKSVKCQIGVDYPHPVVDHAWARERVLNVYRATISKQKAKTSGE